MELGWGYVWSRPGLYEKTRSILTLGILAGLGCFQELGIDDERLWLQVGELSTRSKKHWSN